MRTISYRLFLLAFVTVSFGLLTGFESSAVNNAVLAKTQAASAGAKNGEHRDKSKPKKLNNKHLASAVKNDPELQKPLDLSVSFKDSESAWLEAGSNTIVQAESSNLFTADKKKPRVVDLDGQMIMSQEPEADKRKSLDGAAIVINLKR